MALLETGAAASWSFFRGRQQLVLLEAGTAASWSFLRGRQLLVQLAAAAAGRRSFLTGRQQLLISEREATAGSIGGKDSSQLVNFKMKTQAGSSGISRLYTKWFHFRARQVPSEERTAVGSL